jgi:hypothetical protein
MTHPSGHMQNTLSQNPFSQYVPTGQRQVFTSHEGGPAALAKATKQTIKAIRKRRYFIGPLVSSYVLFQEITVFRYEELCLNENCLAV